MNQSRTRRTLAALAVAGGVALATLTIAPAAQAADGYCGYYSESRAVNSKSACSGKKVASYVKVNGQHKYGPYVTSGQTSWQSANYAGVQAYSYVFRPV
jgi:hypothetical protein